MKSSILSFQNRGNYGSAKYRGNCSGHIVRELLEWFRPNVFVDPSCGSNTSGDVVADLRNKGAQIEYFGLDLHSGFNLLKDSLSARIGGQRCDFAFFHPSYWDLVKYSETVWSNEAHPDDLSNSPTYEGFLEKLLVSIQNIYDCLKENGNLSILIGDIRKAGSYYSPQADLLQIAPGKLTGISIKEQFNCFSDRTPYARKSFVPIMHEYILHFTKEKRVFGMLDATLEVSRKLEKLSRANWSATIRTALNRLGGKAHLSDIYAVIEETAPDKIATRRHWKSRIRCELQRHFRPVERGLWALN
jgi:hypothetical protein